MNLHKTSWLLKIRKKDYFHKCVFRGNNAMGVKHLRKIVFVLDKMNNTCFIPSVVTFSLKVLSTLTRKNPALCKKMDFVEDKKVILLYSLMYLFMSIDLWTLHRNLAIFIT